MNRNKIGIWPTALSLALVAGLAGCANGGDGSGTTGGTTSGTTGGTTSGTTGGTTSGTTGGTTSGTTGGITDGTITCNPTARFRPIIVPNATQVSGTIGPLCLSCSVATPQNAIDADPATIASLITQLGINGSAFISIQDTSTIYPANRRVGYIVADPAGTPLTLNLLQTATVTTVLNSVDQESSAASASLALDLVATPVTGQVPSFLSFLPTKQFNEVRLNYGGVATVLSRLDVLGVCVSSTDGN